jgi:hypothetical protein
VLLLVCSWQVTRSLAWFPVGFSSLAGCVFCGGFVSGPSGVTKATWNVFCAAAVATILTDLVHRSDWCHRSDWRRPSF